MSQNGLLKMWARCVVPGVMAAGTLSAMALSGCDTVARLSFSDRVFNDVRLVGFTSEAGTCKGSSGDAVMRFVLADGDGNPIDNTTVIGNSAVSLGRDDIDVEDVTFFELPDVPCGGDDGAMCSSNFACDDTSEGRACQLTSASVGVSDAPKMISSIGKEQAFAVLVENTASIHGTIPQAISSLKPDYTGPMGVPDGRSDLVGTDYTIANSDRASDDSNARLTAISNLARTWEVVQARAATDNGVRSAFGVWSFGGQRSQVSSVAPGGVQWVYSQSGARQTARALENLGSSNSSAAVYDSILEVLQADDKFGQFDPDDEKILTVIVDGPDDLRLPAVTAQSVIDAATAANVRIFIVHLDPSVKVKTKSGTPLIPDVISYVQQQATPCDPSDANACKNFEACRLVTAFAQNENSGVTSPPDKIMDPYCAINYTAIDAEEGTGRIGPISEYSEIACATGGGYLYFPSRDKLSDGNGTVAKLPLALDSLWEVPVDISAFSNGLTTPGDPYKVGMIFSATVNGTQKRQNMTEDFIEVRPVLFGAP